MAVWDHNANLKSIKGSTPVEKVIKYLYSRGKPGKIGLEHFMYILSGFKNGNEYCHRSLVLLTGIDFGRDFEAWKKWFSQNNTKPRWEWMLQGLAM